MKFGPHSGFAGLTYSIFDNSVCGCPSDRGASPNEDKTACCYGSWQVYFADQLFAPATCGCPENATFQDGVCCKNGLKYGVECYEIYFEYEDFCLLDIPKCGCPGNGTVVGNKCCLQGKRWAVQYCDEDEHCVGPGYNTPDSDCT